MIKPLDIAILQDSLLYLHVSELKSYCEKLGLSTEGKKLSLVSRIIHFLNTGEKINLPKYPAASLSKAIKQSEQKPSALMLKGTYKNDLKTRLFFKSIIGDYFHFTAFGIDWLHEKWMEGAPPTYQEFADIWQKEYEFRKANGSTPKEEWAYINFVKQYLISNPEAGKEAILKQWEIVRNKHKDLVNKIFQEGSF